MIFPAVAQEIGFSAPLRLVLAPYQVVYYFPLLSE